MLVSLFVSFSLDPMLSAYWPDPHQHDHEKGWLTRLLDRFNRWFDKQAHGYTRIIGWALDHRWTVSAIAVLSLGGALAMVKFGLVGTGFTPDSDNSELTVTVEAPPSANLGYTLAKAEAAAEIARRLPEVLYTYVTVGTASQGRTPGVDQASIYVKLSAKDKRDRSQSELGKLLRQQMATVGGAAVSVLDAGGPGGGIKSIQVQLSGTDATQLSEYAAKVGEGIKTLPGVADVGLSTRGPREEVIIEPSRGLAGSLGLTVGDVSQSLRPAFAGIDAGDWVDPIGETRDVNVRLAPEARARPSDLAQLPVTLSNGMTLPLKKEDNLTKVIET